MKVLFRLRNLSAIFKTDSLMENRSTNSLC